MRVKTELKKKLRRDFGVRMRQLRETQGLTGTKMAGMLQIDRGTLKRHEDGQWMPEYPILLKISNAFDVSMDWLLFNKGPIFYKQKDLEAKAAAAR
ncbi:MAG: helix-turn-helix transcriptional regulator [Candidatus Aminicenantes bacterium]|nr:helix-turn-helix transcriptional regulator [Candidatus Aminicenantes bacterium]